MASRLQAIDDMILQLTKELRSIPLLGDQVRVAILEFSDRAEIILPLSDLTELKTIPRLHCKGNTSYGPVFRMLQRVIGHDLRLMQARDTVVYQPLVLFITGGQPTDAGWEQSYLELRSQFQLNLIVVLFGDVSDKVLKELKPTTAVDMRNREDHGNLAFDLLHVVDGSLQTLAQSTVRSAPSSFDVAEFTTGDQPLNDPDL
jgi:uncharacterized protein YegL